MFKSRSRSMSLYGVLLLFWKSRSSLAFVTKTTTALERKPAAAAKCLACQRTISNRLYATNSDSLNSNDNDGDTCNFSTALCVIPPSACWDTIQRARHVARDSTYHKWPPAIRLFHPFCDPSQLSDVALDVARVVEDKQIKPFDICLNQWVIIPHMEALEAELDALQQMPTHADDDEQYAEYEETEVDRLIAREEEVGRRKKKQRQKKELQQQHGQVKTRYNKRKKKKKKFVRMSASQKDAPRKLLEKQRQMYEEFNGPCVVCLEPDEQGKEELKRLRKVLQQELFQKYRLYSPTSSVSTTNELPRAAYDEGSEFRPILPIAKFPTVTSATEMAIKLKGLWRDLKVPVNDLHLVSTGRGSNAAKETSDTNDKGHNNREYELTRKLKQEKSEEKTLQVENQYGCDAKVMLMGMEVKQNLEENAKMANKVMREGIPGAASTEFESLLDPQSDTSHLEGWLDEDDEWDEGTSLVIGRTHFFTGEMRMYVGMPASSAIDGKDRVLGEGVNGAARRRGSVKRAGYLWQDGEYGYRQSDNG